MHLNLDLLLMVIHGQLPPSILVQVIHEHLMETCEQCRLEWEAYSTGHDGCFTLPGAPPPAFRPLPDDPDTWTLEDVEAYGEITRRIEDVSRRARCELAELLDLPREARPRHIRSLPGRYASRATAELLTETIRHSLSRDPREADHLTTLLPAILDRIPEPHGVTDPLPWSTDLRYLARALRAEAHRRLGEHTKADHLFTALHKDLRTRPLHSPAISAEITTYEATLREDQGRHAEAADLHTQAAIARKLAEREAQREAPGRLTGPDPLH